MNARAETRLVYKDIIRDAIYEAIVKGQLLPGERIKELDWAKAYGASQAPVREAIRDLEARGVVVAIPFKGAFVREMTVKDLKDIHKIRAGIEGFALKAAIQLASEDDIASVKKILEDMVRLATRGSNEKFMDEDIHFHQKIIELADMTELEKMWEMCNIRLWTAFNISASKTDTIYFAQTHWAIYDALEQRKEDEAFAVMEKHFDDVLAENFIEEIA